MIIDKNVLKYVFLTTQKIINLQWPLHLILNLKILFIEQKTELIQLNIK